MENRPSSFGGRGHSPTICPVTVVETERLTLRRLEIDDAAFILRLLNDPSFLRFIGDKGVRTLDDARKYISSGPIASYEKFGFGLYLTARKDDGVPIGICGLLKRDSLKDADIGFAFLPEFWSKGYGYESASAVMAYGSGVLGLTRILAVASPDNDPSIRLLEKLGMSSEGMVRLSEGGPELRLLAWEVS
jgi:RimJ/RimL family protein N-acetyltransferase